MALNFKLIAFSFRLRDNTIKMWDRATLSCLRVLNGHTGSVLCLQYDDKVIISGSSDSTVSPSECPDSAAQSGLNLGYPLTLETILIKFRLIQCSSSLQSRILTFEVQTSKSLRAEIGIELFQKK